MVIQSPEDDTQLSGEIASSGEVIALGIQQARWYSFGRSRCIDEVFSRS